MNFEPLIKVLEFECSIYDEYIETEKRKTKKLTESDTEGLDQILNEEQALNMKLNSAEKKRQGIMDGLGLYKKTLSQVIEMSAEGDKEKLAKLLDDLHYRVEAIKQINEYNTRLIKAKLEIVSEINNYFRHPESDPKTVKNATYSKKAQIYNEKDEIKPTRKKV